MHLERQGVAAAEEVAVGPVRKQSSKDSKAGGGEGLGEAVEDEWEMAGFFAHMTGKGADDPFEREEEGEQRGDVSDRGESVEATRCRELHGGGGMDGENESHVPVGRNHEEFVPLEGSKDMKIGIGTMAWLVAGVAGGLWAAPPATVNDGYGELVYVAAGAFKMGDNFGDGEGRERPVHMVELDAFYIGKYEVTNGEWRKFRDDPRYDDPKYWPGGRVMPKDQVMYWTQANNHGGGTPGSDKYPVIGVNWDAAVAYCNWLSAKTGKTYRLPTEAEWEKAARGSDQRRYPWGNTIDATYANFVGTQRFDTVREVGFFDGTQRGDVKTHSNASPYGAFDMAGNVMEWCSDWYQRDWYASSPRKNPKGPATGVYKVVRGGSFFVEGFDSRSYGRSAAWPSFQAHRMIGFRVAREP